MSIIQKFSLLFIFTTLICMPLHSAEQKKAALTTVIKDVRTSLEQVTQNTAKYISEAINTKNSILISRMSDAEKKTKIAEQDKIIATAKQELLKLADNAINIADETEKQASYLSQFVSSARNLGSKAVSSAKDIYYGYSTQERLLAQVVIAELEQLKKTETNLVILKQIDNEIYKQKLISGDEMTMQKKLLIGAAIAAATVAGVALTSHYLSTPSAPSIPSVSLSEQLKEELSNKITRLSIVSKELNQLSRSEVIIANAANNNSEFLKMLTAVEAVKNCLEKDVLRYGFVSKIGPIDYKIHAHHLGRKACESRLEQLECAKKAWETSKELLKLKEINEKMKPLDKEIDTLKNDILILEKQIQEIENTKIL